MFRKKTAKVDLVPEPFVNHLFDYDHARPWTELESGQVAVAGRDALMLVGDTGVTDSGLWHEVQYAKWDAATRALSIVWIQPGRPLVEAVTISEDPKRFMEAVTSRVTDTIVATRSFYTPKGTAVTASIRRRVDGELFSSLVADGPLTADDEVKAHQVEKSLREEFDVED